MTYAALDPLLEILHLLEPLTAADQAAPGAALERRALDELHWCSFCRSRARFALVIGPSDVVGPARWIDACPEHYSALTAMALAWPGDDVILERYEELQRQGRIPAI